MFAFGLKVFSLKILEIPVGFQVVVHLFDNDGGAIARVFQTELVWKPHPLGICFNQLHQLISRLVGVGVYI